MAKGERSEHEFLKGGINMPHERETAQICRIKDYVLGGERTDREGVEHQGELTELDQWTVRMHASGETHSENSAE